MLTPTHAPDGALPTDGWPNEVVGVDAMVPVLGGGARRHVSLDNAASTPPLVAVRDAVDRFVPWYSSVHRGTGFKSQLSTHAFEAARAAVGAFVGADPERQVVIFVKNTTEGLNKLSHALAAESPLVITTAMEHHANMLPWRISGRDTRFVHIDRFGILDLNDLEDQLKQAPTNRPRLVALSGAYNTTGYMPPIHDIARLTHRYGGQLLVDAAQLVAHRPINMAGSGPDDAIDFMVFSSHKLYAPYGAGAVVGPREAFRATPDLVGGGIVDLVTLNRVVWAEIPDREEAGSPNVIGVVALHAAVDRLQAIGMHNIERHEAALSAYALDRLTQVPGLRLLGRPSLEDRVGLFAFGLGNLSGYLVAAILGHEWGVGVRAGCFCAHPGMMHLLDISPERLPSLEDAIILGRNLGAVRASLGLYNSAADVDVLIDGLCAIAAGQIRGRYEMQPSSGEYEPNGWQPRYADFFSAAV
jgi:cysteine desulfurase / selenocysteine lyase